VDGEWLHYFIDVIQRSMLDMIVNLGIALNIANASTDPRTAGVGILFYGQSQISQLATTPGAYL
jgi:hypothetical protein